MEPKNNRNKRLKAGYNFKTSHSKINRYATDEQKKNAKTSNGWMMFVFLLILWLCIFLIAYFKHSSELGYSQIVKNALVIPSGIDFGLCILWVSGRSLIFSHLTYMFYRLSEIMRLKSLKRFLKMNNDDKLFDNMNSYEEYHDYLEIKKQNTKIAFYVSLSFFSILFIITLIIALVN